MGLPGVRHFLRDDDLTPAEQAEVLDLADAMKKDRYATPTARGTEDRRGDLRQDVDAYAGLVQRRHHRARRHSAGHRCPDLPARTSASRSRTPPASWTASVAAIVWRTSGQARIDAMASASQVPVVNALTDEFHPCQVLADLQTVREHKGHLGGLRLTYLGDGANNMAHSYLLGGAVAAMHVRIGTPDGFRPHPEILARAEEIAAQTGGSVEVHTDPEKAVEGTDVVATDTWVSMGREGEAAEREAPFVPYAVTSKVMRLAAPDAIVLHCLPAYRGKEIEAAVLDGPQSVVWDEAENRLHAQKALLAWLLERSCSADPATGTATGTGARRR